MNLFSGVIIAASVAGMCVSVLQVSRLLRGHIPGVACNFAKLAIGGVRWMLIWSMATG